MKVLKFGGTSVGTIDSILSVKKIVEAVEEPVVVVVSALGGITDKLLQTSALAAQGDVSYEKEFSGIVSRHLDVIEGVIPDSEVRRSVQIRAMNLLDELGISLRGVFLINDLSGKTSDAIVSYGERLSSLIVSNVIKDAQLFDSRKFIKTVKQFNKHVVDFEQTNRLIRETFNPLPKVSLVPGFISTSRDNGEVTNLGRGGSDYTASLIGAVLPAEEIQIWTDIDGMHNNDPRVVDNTEAVRQLNFEEAAELAYFGAKILHPTCVQPAKYAGIPVRLKNTMDPKADGTIIDNVIVKGKIKAVAAKDNITAIKIKSSRMLLATGFLRKIFEIFESYQTPIDMIATSEVGVSMSIDNPAHLNEIVDELKKYGTVTVDSDMCIICVVGDLDWSNVGFETLATDAMKNIPVRMISYGGSNYNISFLIKESDKQRALQNLSDVLFNKH